MTRSVLGRVMHDVSAYFVDGLLVDTGPPSTADALGRWCRGREVERIVLTHHHEDHSGGAARLSRELDLPVWAPAGAVPILAEGLRMPLYRYLVWGRRPERFVASPLPGVFRVRGRTYRVIPTSGHAFTHVCFFDPDRRWLFSGDLFVHERVRHLRRIEDLDAHLESLRRILALEPERMYGGHAGVVDDPLGALRRKIDYWEGLREKARELRAQGLSLRRITRRLLGRESLLTWLSFGDFSKKNLARALLQGGDAGLEKGPRIPREWASDEIRGADQQHLDDMHENK